MQHFSYQGLSDSEVSESRKKYGSNVITAKRNKLLGILKEVASEPMLILLVVISLIYFAVDNTNEGIIMLIAILIVSLISIYQQVRSENAVKALAKLSQPLTAVIRNGRKSSISTEEIVYGDIIIIAEGEQVPADAVILQHNDLSVNEAILTGESFPVTKSEEKNELLAGTTILSGSATAKVIRVGNKTNLGKTSALLEQIKKEKTQLQVQVKAFVNRMAFFGFLAFAVVFISNYVNSHKWLDSLMHGLTIAMAVLPEEIPVALSTFMALGAYRMIKNNVIVRHHQTVEALGSATVICIDKTGTVTENKMRVTGIYDWKHKAVTADFKKESSLHLLHVAVLASEAMPFDPMETAIYEAGKEAEVNVKSHTLIKEYPLSGNPPFMTHIYSNKEGRAVITCKGAPEAIISRSKLNAAERAEILAEATTLASAGNRLLAVAETEWNGPLPESQFDFSWDFLGLIILNDPPKANMPEVIRDFYDAGINVKMITGDFPETAMGIAQQIGIRNAMQPATADRLSEMNEEEFRATVLRVNVFARIQPELKLRIINTLKEAGEVVAMTGDGVNDAPALKAAHIGVAMGNRGSEVARNASSLVLVNDDLGSMVTAVALGRKIFSNLKKAIQYIITIHIPLISIVTIPLMLGWKYPNIFSPVHVIFLELIMGPTCSIVFENEPPERDLMKSKPNKFTSMLFTWKELSFSITQGLIITLALLFILYYSINHDFDETTARTMVFTTLIFSNILLTLTGRSKVDTIIETLRYRNYPMVFILVITLIILALALFNSSLQSLFDLSLISYKMIGLCFVVAATAVLWVDIYKLVKVKKNREVMVTPH